MIETHFEEYCQTCTDINPVAEILYADGESCITTIECSNRSICARMNGNIMKALRGSGDKDQDE